MAAQDFDKKDWWEWDIQVAQIEGKISKRVDDNFWGRSVINIFPHFGIYATTYFKIINKHKK